MELREYLFRENISGAAFARKIECDPYYLREIARKDKKPSKRLAKDISNATGGKVSIEEILGIEEKAE